MVLMDRNEIVSRIEETGFVGVIRMKDAGKLTRVIEAVSEGGLRALEITMTTPGALDLIKEVSGQVGEDFLLGAGSVLDPETARQAILAGAEFIVSPISKRELIEMGHRYDKPVIPGAFTPTEVLTAWEQGADVVKIFPASAVGPKYLKDIHGPLPQVKLTPTGGVNLDTAGDFLNMGASFVCVGSALLDKQAIANENWEVLTERADQFMKAVRKAREG